MLHGYPPMMAVLEPGGCATYELPADSDQSNMFVVPGRKEGRYSKGQITMQVSSDLYTGENVTFRCFTDSDRLTDPCLGDISGIVSSFPNNGSGKVAVKACADSESENLALLWEINISTSNDTSKVQGVLSSEARARLRLAQDMSQFDTQLTVVSVVGRRGVGKSTVVSLLSGNDTMFKTGSRTLGTTTTGADMSTIIPTADYATILSEQLGRRVETPDGGTLPLLLIDSEGMGVRGDEFDFITTSPPAIISKVIIYIGSGSLDTNDMLEEIDEYLHGLENIVMDESGNHTSGLQCNEPEYGHFLIVINKMMGNATDAQLFRELMWMESGANVGADKRNSVRDKLNNCFISVEVHGLPFVTVPPGKSFGYEVLNNRFRNCLSEIATTILGSSLNSRIVRVANVSQELNSTNAEVVIATVIDEANKGKVDLSGFEGFWSYATNEIKADLLKISDILDQHTDACSPSTTAGWDCSNCVCNYRNTMVSNTVNKANEDLIDAISQAAALFSENATYKAEKFMMKTVALWAADTKCNSAVPKESGIVCDSSQMDFENPGNAISIECNSLFLCDTVNVDATSMDVTTKYIDLSIGTVVNLVAPAKVADGMNGRGPGDDGRPGRPGKHGLNLTIKASRILPQSSRVLQVNAYGGDGGNGGNGIRGLDGKNGADGTDGNGWY